MDRCLVFSSPQPSLPILDCFSAAVTGYQHPIESASGHASQFYISLLDSNNKELRLDEKGTDHYCDSLSSYFPNLMLISIRFFPAYRGYTG